VARADEFKRKSGESGADWFGRLRKIDRKSLSSDDQLEYDTALEEARRADITERKPGGQTPDWANQ
jgi:uncharacterized protein (DUF885 family)